MAKAADKPEPFTRFEAPTKRLLVVPKEVDDNKAQRPKREREPKEA